jgi:hypothetical protein
MECPYDNYTYFEIWDRTINKSVRNWDDFEDDDEEDWNDEEWED